MAELRCDRCGLVYGLGHNECGGFTQLVVDDCGEKRAITALTDNAAPSAYQRALACRDRQLANQHALMRGCLRRLEKMRQDIDDLAEVMS